ncbi:hypothetical protein [Ponticoccus alexandrii]|nr:hypothetical protein [Ponticoccus alexandrii]
MTDIYKRRKFGPVLEVADALERAWWLPSSRIRVKSCGMNAVD